MGDLALLLTKTTGAAQQALGPQFAAAVQGANASVGSLTDNLQAAVDDTNSPTLSGNLVTSLDAFRRGVESLTRGANPGGAPTPAALATAQGQLQTALAGLSSVTLREMADLLGDRLDTLDRERTAALIAAGVAVGLVLLAMIIGLTGRRRSAVRPPADRDPGRALVRQESGLGNPHDHRPSFGEGDPTRRERSGALR
jgi:hypothetical protein